MDQKYEVVFCIVNSGFSEVVMDSAREAGATGGTVLHASGTANAQAEKLFGITVQPEKDIVMILVDSVIKDQVLHNLYRDVGLKTAGQGIAFTMPVSDVVGITPHTERKHKGNSQDKQGTSNNVEQQQSVAVEQPKPKSDEKTTK